MRFEFIRRFLQRGSLRSEFVGSEQELKRFISTAHSSEWIYLIQWSQNPLVFSWGTSSGSGRRLRFSSLFNPVLQGKYDRRVDYMMLKVIYGEPVVEIFEYTFRSTDRELELKQHLNQKHCWYGISGDDRSEISENIIGEFKKTLHWQSLSTHVQSGFEEYLRDVYFKKPVHPDDSSRTFHWGDSLEPGFLELIGKGHLVETIEFALEVRFPKKHAPPVFKAPEPATAHRYPEDHMPMPATVKALAHQNMSGINAIYLNSNNEYENDVSETKIIWSPSKPALGFAQNSDFWWDNRNCILVDLDGQLLGLFTVGRPERGLVELTKVAELSYPNWQRGAGAPFGRYVSREELAGILRTPKRKPAA